ncbi:hypothetical protein [Sediminitomix flava]|uniref:Uncharacterized protein n=1 Tax=Sediminitomix flava TaxID=379075 RepID=A0A315Z5F4_SEDFL|nr:hypothetical protein [Sediminitomix flava]PWJ39138.1 hypothetical protein BC781_10639 [Sediminitomix flava]
MRLPSFIKLPSNKHFDFPTRFYDADKERIENRKKEIQAELDAENSQTRASLEKQRENLKNRIDFSQYRRDREDRRSSFIFVTVGAVLLISFYIGFTIWLQ